MDPRVTSVRQKINYVGKNVIIRRVAAAPAGQRPVFLDVTVKAVVNGAKPAEVIGGQSGILQVDRVVIIAALDVIEAKWPWPVRHGDKIIIDGAPATVQSVDVRNIGADDAMAVMTVRG